MSKVPLPDSIVVVPHIGVLMFTFVPASVMEVYAGAPVNRPGTLVTFVNGFWDSPEAGLRSVLVGADAGLIDWRHVGGVFNMGMEPAQIVTRAIAARLKLKVTPLMTDAGEPSAVRTQS